MNSFKIKQQVSSKKKKKPRLKVPLKNKIGQYWLQLLLVPNKAKTSLDGLLGTTSRNG